MPVCKVVRTIGQFHLKETDVHVQCTHMVIIYNSSVAINSDFDRRIRFLCPEKGTWTGLVLCTDFYDEVVSILHLHRTALFALDSAMIVPPSFKLKS